MARRLASTQQSGVQVSAAAPTTGRTGQTPLSKCAGMGNEAGLKILSGVHRQHTPDGPHHLCLRCNWQHSTVPWWG